MNRQSANQFGHRAVGGIPCLILVLPVLLLLAIFPVHGQQPATQGDTLYVASLVLTTGVVGREPVDTVQAFTADRAAVYCHVRIFNTYELRKIEFRWLLDGAEYYTMGAKICRSEGWRTFSSVQAVPGTWTVQIVDEDGTVLKRQRFMVNAVQ